MANFNPDDYVQVNERVKKFYQDYPSGRIHTKILTLNDERVVVEAMVWKMPPLFTVQGPANAEARGWEKEVYTNDKAIEVLAMPDGVGQAEEVRAEGFVNRTSALENAETSAIGRALAHMGYEVSKSLSSKEAAQSAKDNQEVLAKPITPAQKTRIYSMLTRLQKGAEAYEKELGKTIDSLTVAEASDIIGHLKNIIERRIAEEVSA